MFSNAKETEINNNNKLIEQAVKTLGDTISYEMVSDGLPRLIADKKLVLNTSVYKPADSESLKNTGIARYLAYDHPDPENPFSIWIFAFAEKQKTAIHDHLYKGTVMVLEDTISEKIYQPVKDSVGSAKVELWKRVDRHTFHCNTDKLNDHFVHQLKRRKALGEGISLTLHIYNMPALNEGLFRRNVQQIFFKAGRVSGQPKPPYECEYRQVQ